jgi:hypothetical protein
MGAPFSGHEVRGVFTLLKPPQAKSPDVGSLKPRDVGQLRRKCAEARGRIEKRERVWSIVRGVVVELEVVGGVEA